MIIMIMGLNLMFQLVMIIPKANLHNENNAFLDEDLHSSSWY